MRAAWTLAAAVLAALALAGPAAAQKAQPKVVGGTVSSPGEWPWMVALVFSTTGKLRCGATRIDEQTLLTAAHCMTDEITGAQVPVGRFKAVLNRTRLSSSDGETHAFAQIVRHPSYSQASNDNDVALVQLSTVPSVTIPAIAPPDDAERGAWETGDPATVIGWGTMSQRTELDPPDPTSDDLRDAPVHVLADSRCAGAYGNYRAATMLCAGETTGGKDACQGDSGGPLVVDAGAGTLRQVGVVSFGRGCALAAFPGVYARVGSDPLRHWIREETDVLESRAQPAPPTPPAPTPPTTTTTTTTTQAPAPQPAPAPVPVLPVDTRDPAALLLAGLGPTSRSGALSRSGTVRLGQVGPPVTLASARLTGRLPGTRRVVTLGRAATAVGTVPKTLTARLTTAARRAIAKRGRLSIAVGLVLTDALGATATKAARIVVRRPAR